MKHEIMTSAIRSHETIVSKLMNPTILPDELLRLVTPIIFIRHPAIILPSWLRAAKNGPAADVISVDDEDFNVWTSLRWSRIIFDYLRNLSHMQQQSGLKRADSVHSTHRPLGPSVVATKPYVIDAVDVVNNTHAILDMICRCLNIDVEGGKQAPASKRYFEKAIEAFKKGLSTSASKKSKADRLLSPDAIEASYRVSPFRRNI